jgi:hypothetical protein
MKADTAIACQLTDAESSLCEFYDKTLVELKRHELRMLYAVSHRLLEHKVQVGDDARASLERLGRRIRKDRTTLLRYAFVPQRVKPKEFEELVALSDARGYPPTFWDFVCVAEFSRNDRADRLRERLLRRSVGPGTELKKCRSQQDLSPSEPGQSRVD